MVRTSDNWEAESQKSLEYQGKTAQKLAQYGLKAARRAPQFSKRWYFYHAPKSELFNKKPETIRFRASFFVSWQKSAANEAKTGTVFLMQGSAVWYDQIRGDWGRLADGAQHRSVTRE